MTSLPLCFIFSVSMLLFNSSILVQGRVVDAKTSPRKFDETVADAAPFDQCGVKLSKRIVGGQHASPGEWRWHAEIYISYHGHVCSGSLVTPQWVITAKHCVDDFFASQITVKLGEHTRSKEGGKKQSHSISLVAWYKKYDLALLKLQKPATINSHVGTICLPEATNPLPVGTVLWQTGWGRISHGGRFPDVLKELEVVIKRQYGYRFYTDATTVGHGSCRGDSGGPVVQERNGRWYLEGVHITGRPTCAQPGGYYDGKIAVRYFAKSIKTFIKNN